MMIKKIYLTVFVLVTSFLLAGPITPPEQGQDLVPGFGGGATGPGAKAKSPIDMYVYVLAGIAVLGAGAYAKKYKTQLK